MDIYIQSEIGVCSEFRPKQKDPISVVISPLRVEGIEGKEGRLKIVSGCNMWRGCQNENCSFSLASRQGPKIRARI